jgi:hypothetical protein
MNDSEGSNNQGEQLAAGEAPAVVGAEPVTPTPTGQSAPTPAQAPIDSPAQPPELREEDFKRGPECPLPRGPKGAAKSRRQLLAVAVDAVVALGIIGLNAAKSTRYHRLNLKQEALKSALAFDPDALTSDDKSLSFEVFLADGRVEDHVNAALRARGLDQFFELVCPAEPTVLNARLARVSPHTPSLSVAWPHDLKGPMLGRTRNIIVTVKLIRRRPGPKPADTASINEPPTATAFVQDSSGEPAQLQKPAMVEPAEPMEEPDLPIGQANPGDLESADDLLDAWAAAEAEENAETVTEAPGAAPSSDERDTDDSNGDAPSGTAKEA